MADSKYKLTYFDLRGMAECIRYMFAYLDIEYEDIRIEKEEWPALKHRQPYGKLPVLEVDDKQLPQSVAICRYLGKRYGLATDDPLKEALLEAIIDTMREVQVKLSHEHRAKTQEARDEAKAEFAYMYSRFELLAAEGYFYGSEPTWVDVYFTGMLDTLLWYKPHYLDAYPNLKALIESIRSKDSVKKYLEQREDKE